MGPSSVVPTGIWVRVAIPDMAWSIFNIFKTGVVGRNFSQEMSGGTDGCCVCIARMTKEKVTKELVERAIARNPLAVRALVAILEPIFRVRIGRVLLLAGDASGRDVDDLCQDTFVTLLKDDGKLARSWNPSRGLSFENYSGLMAKQQAIEHLRKKREELLRGDEPCELIEPPIDSSREPGRLVEAQELRWKVFAALLNELSHLGREMFELLFIDEGEVEEICTRKEMEPDAVYAWRHRLGQRMKDIAATMGGAE